MTPFKIKLKKFQLKGVHDLLQKVLKTEYILAQLEYLDYYNLQRLINTLYKKLGTLSVIPDDHKLYALSVDPNEYRALYKVVSEWRPSEDDLYLVAVLHTAIDDLHKQYHTRQHSVGYQLFPGMVANDGRILYHEGPRTKTETK